MKFETFDTRHYPMLDVREGYGEWAASYDGTVLDVMDLRLLDRLRTVDWPAMRGAVDLGCGTGRTGVWLRRAGIEAVDGIDLTPEMLERVRQRNVHRRLELGDVAATPFASEAYDLVITSLVDEHLATLTGLYAEARRLARPGGRFVLVGYHPHFLMFGIPGHFDRADGQSVGIESHVHLTSDHVAARLGAGFTLLEMIEGIVDEDWAAEKPKWAERYWGHPVTFTMVWG